MLFSAWQSYQTASPPKEQRELLDLLSDDNVRVDWVSILSELPQYKEPEVLKAKSEANSTQEQQISDSQIIGIIVDAPKSILLLIDSDIDTAPQQLSLGEGWLKNWKIQTIEADSITWVNTLNQQTYIQTLFASVENDSKNLKTNTGTL